MSQPTISCIFPVHNEAKILKRTVTEFTDKWQKSHLPKTEIILVENGSHDNSWKVIKSLARSSFIKGFQLNKASYGQALKAGLNQARGKVIFIFNVDFYDIEFAKNALQLLKVADIVIGSKTLAASRDERAPFRRLTTYFFNVLLRLVLNYPGTDTHGIKAFRNTSLLTYSINRCRTRNELFDTELIIRMTRWDAKLVELPVTVHEIRPTRYAIYRRIMLTVIDLVIALWSKYLHLPNFEKKVVVADDYGLSMAINKAILTAIERGEIQYVSVLGNMITPSMAQTLKRHKKLKHSAHLNLIEGKPKAPKNSVPSLVNPQGSFYPLPTFLWRLSLGLIAKEDITREWIAQIQWLKKLGLTIEHVDSHQHTHVFPPLWNQLIHVIPKWNISQIRSQDSTRYSLQPYPLKYIVYLFFLLLLTVRYGFNRSSPEELNEVIVHPGANY